MPNIQVKLQKEQTNAWVFDVVVSEDNGKSTNHTVEVGKHDYERLTGGKVTPVEFVRESFRFLLTREPKESILGHFNLMEISKYFPEYEKEISNF